MTLLRPHLTSASRPVEDASLGIGGADQLMPENIRLSRRPEARPADALHTVTQLAADLGITARTIRFYEDKGLISPQRAGSTRVYTVRDRARMILILRGKRLGFSLRAVKEYLDLYDADQSQAGQIRALLGAVQKRLDMLKEQRRALETTIDELEDIQRQANDALALKLGEPRAMSAGK